MPSKKKQKTMAQQMSEVAARMFGTSSEKAKARPKPKPKPAKPSPAKPSIAERINFGGRYPDKNKKRK